MLNMRLSKEENLLTFAGVFTWGLVSFFSLSHTSADEKLISALILSLFLIIFLAIATDAIQKISATLCKLLVMVLAVLVLVQLTFNHTLTPILLVIWATLLPEFFSRGRSIALLIGVNLLYFLMLTHYLQIEDASFSVLVFAGFQLFALSSSLARHNERESRLVQEQLNQQLVATRALLSQTSQQQERLRISRDLHDILGHQLTALSLQLEVLSHTAPESCKAQIGQSKQLTKDLLESIRAVVRAQQSNIGLDIKPALVALMSRLPGIDLQFGELKPLESTALAQTLVLILQEGISNAIRHGNATQLTVSMTKLDRSNDGDRLQICLQDNGRGNHYFAQHGTGLNSMKARLADYAGDVTLVANDVQGCSLLIQFAKNASPLTH